MARAGVEHVIVHTGQHYDPMLSDVFFEELGIPAPDEHLGVGSGSHGRQTGAILAAMDDVLERQAPDCVLVYGDTNSTLAAALSAVKLHIPLAHLEAGLRSFNRAMPEEHNRVLTDHAADLCLAPTDVAMGHLNEEGLADRARLVGDVMTDVLYAVKKLVQAEPGIGALPHGVHRGDYLVATIHRAENTEDADRLGMIIASLAASPRPVLLLAHPRLVDRARHHGIALDRGAIRVGAPLSYRDLVSAVLSSGGVVTDSGGLQKEAFLLRRPCTTIRTETEWVETVELGWNVLANTPDEIAAALARPAPRSTDATPYGTGTAADSTVEEIARFLSDRATRR